jgi:nucleoside-diphosphate-sugar epimerase
MTILVTGVAGFIGSNFPDVLLIEPRVFEDARGFF